MIVIVLAEQPPEQTSQPDGATVIVGMVVVALLGYLVHCAIAPYKDCITCHDKKKWRSSLSGNVFRLCARCRGRGKEYRLGARLMRGLAGYGWGRHE